jgi:glycosyltransferase involved in cell wall biosynthesis
MAVIKKIPKIAILMCTYNGEQFLNEQLDSIKIKTIKIGRFM